MKDGSKKVDLIMEAVKEGGVLTCQTSLLHSWLARNILLGDHQRRHLRPHGGQRDWECRGDVFSCFDLVVGEDEAGTIFINHSL